MSHHLDTKVKNMSTSPTSISDYIPSSSSLPLTNTLILLDWDDTLLPSSWLIQNGVNSQHITPSTKLPSSIIHACHEQLDSMVHNFLVEVMKYGTPMIITSANKEWVELSCQLFLPHTFSLLSSIEIISARSQYATVYPTSSHRWKIEVFHEILFPSFTVKETMHEYQHVLSIGDGNGEREALHTMKSLSADFYAKSIKFLTQPTFQQLQSQLKLMTKHLKEFCLQNNDLDLKISKEMVQ